MKKQSLTQIYPSIQHRAVQRARVQVELQLDLYTDSAWDRAGEEVRRPVEQHVDDAVRYQVWRFLRVMPQSDSAYYPPRKQKT